MTVAESGLTPLLPRNGGVRKTPSVRPRPYKPQGRLKENKRMTSRVTKGKNMKAGAKRLDRILTTVGQEAANAPPSNSRHGSAHRRRQLAAILLPIRPWRNAHLPAKMFGEIALIVETGPERDL
jgi:hypothetical protein